MNTGDSILPSSCPEILRPMAYKGGTLQVVPNVPLDTHELTHTHAGGAVVIASHPNGYSCYCLAKHLIDGDTKSADEQAAYIIRCGGWADIHA